MKGFNYHSLRWQNNASYDTFSLDPTLDVPICPSVDNCLFNYYNVSVMHNCSMDIRRHWCVASIFSCEEQFLLLSKFVQLYNIIVHVRPFIPFSHIDAFLRLWNRSLSKTLWQKKKLLKTSNFSFYQNVFNSF